MSVMRMLLLGCLLAAALVPIQASEYKCEEDAGSCPENRGIQCGGYGECICGHCACQPGFYGDSCQCSSVTCSYSNGKICGGPDRGRCECGVCKCKQGFAGEACECPLSQNSCVASNGVVML
ncbi:integrin beta-2-like protein [Lingula anatina]|uniref:Integrin beta-2-like protein n=1 Tax=Lingula anatina TaxID=7574 RepID=A0A1S3K682_LINAN|nr:integrin beta-2-like protein [Lingula anatina]|eukprot:XP_013418143.1 integrin beta-2-like protein [Lingula anatina]